MKSKNTNRSRQANTNRSRKPVYSIIGNESYGLFFGKVKRFDASKGVAIVEDCRHICEWRGKNGGITSLASHGICGPDAAKSRIGLPGPLATLTGVKNVFGCTDLAAKSIIEYSNKNASNPI